MRLVSPVVEVMMVKLAELVEMVVRETLAEFGFNHIKMVVLPVVAAAVVLVLAVTAATVALAVMAVQLQLKMVLLPLSVLMVRLVSAAVLVELVVLAVTAATVALAAQLLQEDRFGTILRCIPQEVVAVVTVLVV